ncbi:hypothetical protein MBOU_58190 [Mycobacterium bourgelatii]|uniref:Uncharacterized protein n=1 Tax=Mycobacterium bourgelatii TaxID=1273442 RepID=A0A7I9YZ21_MYCBU|nr:hypothetical protein MBOU_58190 [Mycobacterium bourgelatii]
MLERAAAALAAEYPLLRVSIAADPGGRNPTFVPSAGPIPIRRVSGDAGEWIRQVEQHELSHDQLCWNFAYADGVISELSARRYADACVQILLGTFDETTESGGGQWNSGS